MTRLKEDDWQRLKTLLRERQIRGVAVNVPTTWRAK